MSVSPSSSAQAAREAVAARLRDLRLDAGLTGRGLAVRCGWSEAKTSRIENARTPPSDADLRAWCEACDVPEQIPDLIAASRNAESLYVEWRRLQRTGLRRLQESYVPLYERTRKFRVYCSTVMPGVLQTREYASALLGSITQFHGAPDDVEQAVDARLARSRIVHEGGRHFALLVEEAVLRYQIGDAETMAGQLGHLLSLMTLPSVSLGVIPFGAGPRRLWTLETFSLYDSGQAFVELLTAQVTITAPSEMAMYERAFSQMSRLAVYGPEARALIGAAAASLG
ncbi:helix-turn-helix domain-containing protein [Streptomyces specialis]|uniref:helix-turn-helix domain-containing protein n=1 Tax=Streptomyces specialis TaxID=498367 RepID=UPI00073F0076|nr:helix-turn-helix transcriptional regulator [Streptomyces specialis]